MNYKQAYEDLRAANIELLANLYPKDDHWMKVSKPILKQWGGKNEEIHSSVV